MFYYNILDALVALNDESAKELPMVYRLWYDGEITMEKGGDLLGQRSLHMMSMPVLDQNTAELLREDLKSRLGQDFIWLADDKEALKLIHELKDNLV